MTVFGQRKYADDERQSVHAAVASATRSSMKSCIPALRQFTVVGLLVLASPRLAEAQAAPLWDTLSPGPHAVGFRSFWEFDHSRRYNITFDDKTRYATGKAARPILINVWYPATKTDNAARMPHRDYLKIRSDDPRADEVLREAGGVQSRRHRRGGPGQDGQGVERAGEGPPGGVPRYADRVHSRRGAGEGARFRS